MRRHETVEKRRHSRRIIKASLPIKASLAAWQPAAHARVTRLVQL